MVTNESSNVLRRKPLAAVGIFNRSKDRTGARVATMRRAASACRSQARPLTIRSFGRADSRRSRFHAQSMQSNRWGGLVRRCDCTCAIPEERDNYFGHRATLATAKQWPRPKRAGVIDRSRAAIASKQKQLLRASRYSEAKDAATQAMRLGQTTTSRARSAQHSCAPATVVFRLTTSVRGFHLIPSSPRGD